MKFFTVLAVPKIDSRSLKLAHISNVKSQFRVIVNKRSVAGELLECVGHVLFAGKF